MQTVGSVWHYHSTLVYHWSGHIKKMTMGKNHEYPAASQKNPTATFNDKRTHEMSYEYNSTPAKVYSVS
jgi:hypothetical protein